jgi:UDP-N-acetylmuramoyl-tripeptide--D-alanyl-D-alanine ligase
MTIPALYQIFMSCSGVTTDSRNCPENSLFFALKGDSFDGNQFAETALQTGCSYVVVDNPQVVPDANDRRYILVDDVLTTLQQLANYHRHQLGTRIIGITGTNGKTTTKELVSTVLAQSHNVLYTLGNYNNHIGVPLTLLRLKADNDLAVIEMGANHPGEIKFLVNIAEPNYGLITNVGKAHLEGFGSFEGVIRTKGELYDFLRNSIDSTVFIHHDNPYLMKMSNGLNIIPYGTDNSLYVNGHVTDCSPYLTFEWKAGRDGERHEVQTHLIGDYNFPNALAAVTVGRFFGVEPQKIDKALREYRPSNNRSQLEETGDNTLIIDTYNANPTSMMASLQNFFRMKAENKMLILGDMLELGAESQAEHQKIVDFISECGFKDVILVGKEFATTRSPYEHYPDAESLIKDLKQNKPKDHTILIKGSNGIKLFTVPPYL